MGKEEFLRIYFLLNLKLNWDYQDNWDFKLEIWENGLFYKVLMISSSFLGVTL